MAFAEAEWLRLNVPLIFRTFWMARFGIHLYIYLASSELSDWADIDNLKTLFKVMLIRGCETLPAILGMSSIFSWFAGKVRSIKTLWHYLKYKIIFWFFIFFFYLFSSFMSCVSSF